MSSPIHKFLFSPPPSPPRDAADRETTSKHGLTSLKSMLLPTELIPRSSLTLDAGSASASTSDLKARSPRTPQQRHFAFESYPSPLRGLPGSTAPHVAIHLVEDVEATPRSATVPQPSTPRRTKNPNNLKISTPPYLPSNVPSSPQVSMSSMMPGSLPKPVLRLLFLVSLLASSILILTFVPGARLPSLKAASISRRLALAPDGRAYVDVANEPNSWTDAVDRDYAPPQIRAPHMMKRSRSVLNARRELDSMVPHPLKAVRPVLDAHPLPRTHELLAVQSYLLDSDYNVLPSDLDPSMPLDAHSVLGIGSSKLGKPGSEAEKAWLSELELEREDDIVIWYGGDGFSRLPHALLDLLRALHGPERHPTLIPCHGRSDLKLLHGIFDRLELPIKHHPLVMIGNEPIIGDDDLWEELRGSGKLTKMLEKVGWVKPVKTKSNSSQHKGGAGEQQQQQQQQPRDLE